MEWCLDWLEFTYWNATNLLQTSHPDPPPPTKKKTWNKIALATLKKIIRKISLWRRSEVSLDLLESRENLNPFAFLWSLARFSEVSKDFSWDFKSSHSTLWIIRFSEVSWDSPIFSEVLRAFLYSMNCDIFGALEHFWSLTKSIEISQDLYIFKFYFDSMVVCLARFYDEVSQLFGCFTRFSVASQNLMTPSRVCWNVTLIFYEIAWDLLKAQDWLHFHNKYGTQNFRWNHKIPIKSEKNVRKSHNICKLYHFLKPHRICGLMRFTVWWDFCAAFL